MIFWFVVLVLIPGLRVKIDEYGWKVWIWQVVSLGGFSKHGGIWSLVIGPFGLVLEAPWHIPHKIDAGWHLRFVWQWENKYLRRP